MPLSFRQAGNLFVAGPNISIYPSGNSFAISGSASGGGGGGGVTGLTSAGTGNRLIFSSITNNNLVQKSISAGTGVVIIESSDGTLTFSATSTGGGITGPYVSGLTSAGTGNILFLSSITNNNLVQKSISAGTGVGITESNGTITFSASSSSGTIISGVNSGTGVAVFSGVVGTNMVFRTIRAGANAGVFLSGNDIIFSATTGSINGVTAVTNVGGGIIVASSVTSGALISRTLSGSNGIDVTESGNLVIVRPSPTLTTNRFLIAGTGGAITTNEAYQVDASVGTMALGFGASQSNTTARLLIAQGSGAISQIRFTSFTARYSGATAGDIFYNSTSGNSLFFNKTTTLQTPFIFKDNNFSLTSSSLTFRILEADTGGTISASRNFQELGVFNSITSTTISGISELSVINTGTTVLVGTNILKASSDSLNPQLVTGKKFRFNARGTIQTTSSAGSLIARMKLGSVLIASSSTSLHQSIPSNSYFEINATFTIRSQGTTGVVLGSAYMLTDHTNLVTSSSNIAGVRAISTTGSTIATTADTAFDFTLQNETQANNIYVINEATLEYLN